MDVRVAGEGIEVQARHLDEIRWRQNRVPVHDLRKPSG
jgi:hypothetical protein